MWSPAGYILAPLVRHVWHRTLFSAHMSWPYPEPFSFSFQSGSKVGGGHKRSGWLVAWWAKPTSVCVWAFLECLFLGRAKIFSWHLLWILRLFYTLSEQSNRYLQDHPMLIHVMWGGNIRWGRLTGSSRELPYHRHQISDPARWLHFISTVLGFWIGWCQMFITFVF